MKKRVKKKVLKKINKLFKKISKSKTFKYLQSTNIFVRLFISIILITFSIIAYIIPPIPGATPALILGLWMFFTIKQIKSKILYLLNKSRIKHYIILMYIQISLKKKQDTQLIKS